MAVSAGPLGADGSAQCRRLRPQLCVPALHRRPCRRQAWRGVRAGEIVRRTRLAARLPLPGRCAADRATEDRAAATDLPVALAVTEDIAAHVPLVTTTAVRAVRLAVPALSAAEVIAAWAVTLGASRLAVDVITRLATAEPRAVGLPPASGKRARRALVGAVVDGAAQRGPPGRASVAAAAHRRV